MLWYNDYDENRCFIRLYPDRFQNFKAGCRGNLMSLFERAYFYFEEISKIPRGSGNEEAVSSYVEQFAKDRNLFVIRDSADNIYIRKDASAGRENDPGIVMQGHLDMVCEVNSGTPHDFLKDPIRLVRNGDILTADGTTLGADDGVAVALMLAVLESDTISIPPLECIFTTDEEAGMTGMRAFDTSVVKGRRMINLDSEGEGIATVSCAGGVTTNITFPCDTVPVPAGYSTWRITVSGLLGGHSGADIHLPRANAIKLAAQTLRNISEFTDIRIISVTGGSKGNAIPRECCIVFAAENGNRIADANRAEAFGDIPFLHHPEFDINPNWKISTERTDTAAASLACSDALLGLLTDLPFGVIAMSRGIPGLVESSSNPGIVRADASGIDITVTSRSSVESELDQIEENLTLLTEKAGGSAEHHDRYPGWEYRENTPMQQKFLAAFRRLFGREAKVIGLHAGLECGLFMERVPDMDIIAIGPEVTNLHSPDETLLVSTYERLCVLVQDLLSLRD